jgi:GTP-binding protein
VLLVDSRLGLTPLDQQLLEFVAPRVVNGSVKLLVLLTKADKLNKREQQSALAKTQEALAVVATEEADVSLLLFSAPKQIGLGDLAETLHGWTHPVIEPELAPASLATEAAPDPLPPA